jgi:hypothetical protein
MIARSIITWTYLGDVPLRLSLTNSEGLDDLSTFMWTFTTSICILIGARIPELTRKIKFLAMGTSNASPQDMNLVRENAVAAIRKRTKTEIRR